ncbi:MAG: efflux RND transporter periplasmic adaptor subunit [Candidatus Eisenbacteria bacterium]
MRKIFWLAPLLVIAALAALPSTRRVAKELFSRLSSHAEAETQRGAEERDGGAAEVSAGEAPVAIALPVVGRVVTRGPFRLTVSATGRAEAVRRAELSPRVGERIAAVRASEGRSVGAGSTLVEMDARPFEIALRQAEAQAARAEMDYKAALIGQPDANDETKTLLRHRSGLTAAQEDLARARLDFEGATLTAPFAGVVASMRARVGERATPNQPLCALVDLSTLRVPAEVLENAFGSIRVGARAKVRFPALGARSFAGTVEALGPEIDAARGTGIAYIAIPNPDQSVRPGMYAEVEIEGEELPDRLVVPRSAVLERDRRLLVFRARDGRRVELRASWALAPNARSRSPPASTRATRC